MKIRLEDARGNLIGAVEVPDGYKEGPVQLEWQTKVHYTTNTWGMYKHRITLEIINTSHGLATRVKWKERERLKRAHLILLQEVLNSK